MHPALRSAGVAAYVRGRPRVAPFHVRTDFLWTITQLALSVTFLAGCSGNSSRDNSDGTTPLLVLSSTRTRGLFVAAAIYALILTAFWFVAEHFSLGTRIGHMPSTFAAFALLFAPH
jgi:hypothetical protein